MWPVIPKLSLLPLLIWSTANYIISKMSETKQREVAQHELPHLDLHYLHFQLFLRADLCSLSSQVKQSCTETMFAVLPMVSILHIV